MCKQLVAYAAVEIRIRRCIDGSCCRQHTDRSAFGIEQCRFRRTAFTSIAQGEVTGSKQPERQVLIAHRLDVLLVQHRLVRNRVITAMTRIIEEQRSITKQVHQSVLGQRITLSAGVHFLRIRVEENLMNHEIRICYTYALRAHFCCLRVGTVLTVVRQIDQLVLPFAGLLVAHVADQLIHRRLRLLYTLDRQTAYTDIHLTRTVRSAFIIIQETEIVLSAIRLHLIDRVLGLIGQQQACTRIGQQLTVIKTTVPHEQQPSRFLDTAAVRPVV